MVAVLTAPLGLQADSVVSVLPLLLVLTLVPPLGDQTVIQVMR